MTIILRMVPYLPSQNKIKERKNMKDLKAGISLIVLGNLLYITNHFLTENVNINDFVSGLLLGISIGVNLIGIVLSAKYMAKNK